MPVTTTTFNSVPAGTTWEGAAPFIIADPDPWSGTTNALSLGSLGLSTSVAADLPSFTMANAGRIYVRYNIESEPNYDLGKYFIDGVEKLSVSGDPSSSASNWRTGDLGAVAAGSHTLRLTYSEDYAASRGFDNLHTGSIYVVDGDISNLTVTNLLSADNNTDIFVHWNSFTEGLAGYSFEWSIDGGTNIYTTSNAYVNVTGLAPSTNYTFQVRPVSTTYGNGAWATKTIRLSTAVKGLGPITSNYWAKNATEHQISLTQPEIVFHDGSSNAGGIAGRLTMQMQASTMSAELWVQGGDRVEMGVVSAATSADTPGAGGWGSAMPTQNLATQLFTGFSIDIWTANTHAYINGTLITSVSNSSNSTAAYVPYAVKYAISSGTLTMQLYKNNVVIHTASAAAPYTLGRPVVVGGSGSAGATYKIRNSVTWEVTDLTSKTITNGAGYPVNGRATYIWDKILDASSYEYSLDGGTTPVSTGTNNFIELTGLTNGTPRSIVVRALSSLTSTATPWSDPISATPTTTPTYTSVVIDKDPSLCLPLDEVTGTYKDLSINRQIFTPLAENRGKTPLTSDSTQAVETTGTSGLGIARGQVVSGMVSTTQTMEMWLRMPPNTVQLQGSFLKIGDNNGWGIGIGRFGTQTNLGRNLIGITEGQSWMATAFDFNNPVERPYHLVVTRNATTYNYYLDTVLVGTTTAAQTDPTGQVHVGTTVGNPGRVMSSGIQIDAVAVYPSVLTVPQITENFNAGARMYAPTGLEAVPLNGGVAVRWPTLQGATSFDISNDGGTTWTTQAAPGPSVGVLETASVKITGKTNGTPVSTVVRAKSSNSTSAWSAPIDATPSATRYVIHWDNFNRAPSTTDAGTPQVGGPYTVVAGPWGIDSEGRLYSVNNNENRLTFPGSANFDFQFQIPVGPSNNQGILFRYTDTTNQMMFFREGNSETSNRLRLYRSINSNNADLATYGYGDLAKVTDTYRVIGMGNLIHVYVNGVRLTYREDARASGGVIPTTLGFYQWASSNGRYDNVVVWNTPDIDVLGPANGKTAHVYKGRDNYNDDLGNTP